MSQWQDSCYLLHKRPFKDYYSWAILLTAEHGLTSACIREYKKQRTGVEPLITFGRYWCQGREGQILKLNKIELEAPAVQLSGLAAVSGLYINELIVNTCKGLDLAGIFPVYTSLLSKLMLGRTELLIALREFELLLLQELGYGFDWQILDDYQYFHYQAQNGFIGTSAPTKFSFQKVHLLAISQQDWQVPGALATAKRLTKQAFELILDGKQLQTYTWFQG